ncbi:hypothetical protein DL770_006261 [Monosporascus sp. CRB-9-2]|nr:hypothetical protein DL770_006261 [Monosporascus sp. CRB-9-2]
MTYHSKDFYPRPDFVHANQRWHPINDGWSLLYDDEDVGLKEAWHINGVPDKVALATSGMSEAEAQRLAAFPELKEKGFEARNRGENVKQAINVPFVFQTPASGLNDNEAHEVLWYERKFSDPRDKSDLEAGDRVLIRFGAVDYEMTLWASGHPVGHHRGGHVPFDVDITDALSNAWKNSGKRGLDLVMRVRDSPYDLAQPRGKQYWGPQPESIFYTPSSGIWQTVWTEIVPATRIGNSSYGTVLKSNNISEGLLEAKVAVLGRRAGHQYSVEIEGKLHGHSVATRKVDLQKDKDYAFVDLSLSWSKEQQPEAPRSLADAAPLENPRCWSGGVALWSPDYPTLYDVTIRLCDVSGKVVDEVNTYTGFRSLDWNKGDRTFRLNGEPLFQALCLDQGYWPETGMTPPSPESVKTDIELSKKMGFNGCRKHQKVEDPLFLYWADKLGYLVWGEIANAYEFNQEYAARFEQEWKEAVMRDINHPCVVAWTPVNESWGYPSLKGNVTQRTHVRSLYYLTKTLDPTRPVNDNCGWEHVITDLSTFHDYNDAPALAKSCATLEDILGNKLDNRGFFAGPISVDGKVIDEGTKHREGAPVLCTEFGGVNIKPAAASQGRDRDWGYTTASDPQDLLKRIESLMMAVVQAGHICGFVYTQLTDIEQEVNGLYSFDRKEKIPASEVKEIIDKAAKVYYDSLKKE